MATLRSVLVAALVLSGAVGAPAQGTIDNLSCFRVRDSVPRGSVRAILNGLGGQSCRIKVPAALACIATAATSVTPSPPASSPSDVSSSFLCYSARCSPPRPPRSDVEDAFGRRPVRFRGARWVCLPGLMGAAGGSTTTTIPGATTTTVPGSTVTTTTTPGTPGGCTFSNGQCRGTCGSGKRCGSAAGTASCACRSVSCGEADAPACNGACADPGKACVFVVTGCDCINVPG